MMTFRWERILFFTLNSAVDTQLKIGGQGIKFFWKKMDIRRQLLAFTTWIKP
jgi:hypothetical protein